MERRAFLRIASLPALAFIRPRIVAPPDPPLRAGLVYSDSDGNTSATLDRLKDNNTTAPGVPYAA